MGDDGEDHEEEEEREPPSREDAVVRAVHHKGFSFFPHQKHIISKNPLRCRVLRGMQSSAPNSCVIWWWR